MTDPEDVEAAWARLEAAAESGRNLRLADLITPERVERFSVDAAGLHVDLSRQAWTDEGFGAAMALARKAGVAERRAAMFVSERINTTEGRAVEHWALRAPELREDIAFVRERWRSFAEAVRSGAVRAADGRRFRSILHIGIGGSDLGPRLLWEALKPARSRFQLRFVANIDPSAFEDAVADLDPRRTLVVVVSKSFGTQETIANLDRARAWLGLHASSHLAAVSSAPERAATYGICGERVFGMPDSVGGRFSVWAPVSLSCAIGLGWRTFARFLAGAAAMDRHFRNAPFERNGPVLMAMAEIYNRNGLGRGARAVIPYAQRLALLPAWLQQLEMESNGKTVGLDGERIGRATAPVVFGDAGTNAQHAFFQLLHQGTDVIPVDFVLPADRGPETIANGLAQAEALLHGQESDEAHRRFEGGRPSTTILMPGLDARSLGALMALYEHKTFVEGAVWGLNSFDQWGVELGKTLAKRIQPELEGRGSGEHDASTAALIARLRP